MIKKDLEFLLKEKYGYSDVEIFELFRNNVYPEKDLAPDIVKDIRKLKRGYPLDYLIGYKHFLGAKIDLSKKPLIPRPETEYWVNQVLQGGLLCEKSVFLDIFTGSGCIGISIIRHLPDAFVVFSDISQKALEQVEINVNANKINLKCYQLIKSDLFSKLADTKVDAIFANPPYVDIEDQAVSKELKYEPKTALFADTKGLGIIFRFLDEAYKYLNEGGLLFMEFGGGQKSEIDKFLRNHGKYNNWKFYRDQYRKWRWLKTERATS